MGGYYQPQRSSKIKKLANKTSNSLQVREDQILQEREDQKKLLEMEETNKLFKSAKTRRTREQIENDPDVKAREIEKKKELERKKEEEVAAKAVVDKGKETDGINVN
ncbi:hypothetical protein SLS60_006918 [Paraconiothyrium brasiliense]|uniref:Uncharacterized protein n=1 Tax=Paraconiothyrium brasiliense TaxID=300254 RepID=A0ABR3R861_9PLEO